jgi:hypothetical protein
VADEHDLIAYCGLYCGACSFRVAFLENDRRHLDGMPSKYDQYREAVLEPCAGCRREDGGCGHGIKECARARGLAHCGECVEFPCERSRRFCADGIPHHADTIRSLTRLRAAGARVWAEEQLRHWTCACGAHRSWYVEACLQCGRAAPAGALDEDGSEG